jgi:MGT family glycosyltransferase
VIPAHSDVQSALPVAEELIGRGDEVTFYLTEQFEPHVRRIGAGFRPLDPSVDLYDELARGTPLSSMADLGKLVGRLGPLWARLFTDGLRAVPAMVEGVRAERADCIVYNTMCPWGLALARMLELPAVTFSTTWVMKPVSNLEQTFSAMAGSDAMTQALRSAEETAEELHAGHGMPRLRLGDMLAPDERVNLVPVTRQFQPDADGLDERYLFIGPSIRDRGDHGDFPLERLADGSNLYISLGTAISQGAGADFARLCFDAFGDGPWRVVLATGRGTDPGSLGAVPANFLVRTFVPQLDVLARAEVFVTHCGVNSVMESIWHGVPMVGIPHTIEQLMNADRAAELGLAVRLEPGGITPASLRDAVQTVSTDPGYRQRLAEASQWARQAGGYERAADAIQAAAAMVAS